MTEPMIKVVRPLSQAEQKELDLIGEISHEIGNPLFVIAGFSELLLAHPKRNGLTKETAKRIKAIHQMALRAGKALNKIQAEAEPSKRDLRLA